jgi:hypothetical protein
MADVAAVILAGGHAHLAAAERVLGQELLRPVIRLDDPELAAVRGGVRFAMAAPARRLPADHPRWRVEPLSSGRADRPGRLERWLVGPGEAYQRQSVLARSAPPTSGSMTWSCRRTAYCSVAGDATATSSAPR